MTGAAQNTRRCAICGRPRENEAYRPFCSKRCADVDLQRWLSGGYVVPGEAVEDGGAGPVERDDEG